MFTTLQLHGAYLMAVGKLMIRDNRSAYMVTSGYSDEEIAKAMHMLVPEVEYKIALAHCQRCDMNIASNAQL